ncbi:MAG: dTMP kinase [Treponema sp.]|nr:dTMP kinase [Treponema sp.]
MEILPNFVVFEGGDGSGTTTQLTALEHTLSMNTDMPLPAIHKTFEPTDGPVGRLIRQGMRGEITLKNETIACLFAADRYEHIYGPAGVEEQCKQGKLVVCDRYFFSSLVYQGITCGEDLPLVLNRGFPLPELVLFFDIDPETSQKRISGRSQKEIYETYEFQLKVRERYKSVMQKYSGMTRAEVIDASLSKEEVSAQVWRVIGKMPIFRR